MNDYQFGNFLCTLRQEKGLSQSQLGEMLGVTNKAVSKWENGSAKPNTKLLPKIATIFDVSIEELFACKRIEINTELVQLKRILSNQKRKYAILSSVFLAMLITLPIMMVEFICIVLGFHLPDEVIGPLGSACFILLFVVTLTAYIIFHINHKRSMILHALIRDNHFDNRIKKGYFFSCITWASSFMFFGFIYYVIRNWCNQILISNLFLASAGFVMIVILAVIICYANIVRLLSIKVFDGNDRKRVRFSEMPVWCKICYVGAVLFFPISLCIRRGLLFIEDGWLTAKIISIVIWGICGIGVIIYTMRKR